jgi:CHASE2 domain/CHAT domain
MTLQLDVQRDHQVCSFRLSWGKGQRLSATLPYPASLTAHYQAWHRAYLDFYRRLSLKEPIEEGPSNPELRGRVDDQGALPHSMEDWRFKLVQAEVYLLTEFHRWLNSVQLIEVRRQIAHVARGYSEHATSVTHASSYVDLFLTCHPMELERLPWEAWEITTEFATDATVRIVRFPENARESVPYSRRRRSRILVILGDDTGLDFEADRKAVRSLSRLAEIQFIGWKPGQDARELLTQITAAITDERGWDVLLFAGHSNEAELLGGELAIAPGMSISISEIKPQLEMAKARGLQFALFNSCNGLSIARALIGLGLSQVAIMREPVHNQVSQEFLVSFLRNLATSKDVHESLLAACQELKLEKNLTYPSAYLVPSLFRHPAAELFRIKPVGIREWLKQWLPNQQEAIALSALVVVSVLLPVQGFLLDQRIWSQAVYRRITSQISLATPPPILLVQIDNASITKAEISDPNPMDREYLAKLVNQLSQLHARVVGIDYLLDRSHKQQSKGDEVLAKSIQGAIERQPQRVWFVFAKRQGKDSQWTTPILDIANPNWSLQGDMDFREGFAGRPAYMLLIPPEALVPQSSEAPAHLPLSYLLAVTHRLTLNSSPAAPRPDLKSNTDLQSQLLSYLNQSGPDPILPNPTRLQFLTMVSYLFKQMWLHPIIDFSIPPAQAYDSIPAWELLEGGTDPLRRSQLQQLRHQVVLIIPGGYESAGVEEKKDNYNLPAAVRHWRFWQSPPGSLEQITGGEVHAYMLYQFLNQRLVVPIPDLWMIGMAALLGKGTVLVFQERLRRHRTKWSILLASTTAVYGVVSLQLYISAAVLLPWFLPSLTFWTYVLPELRRNNHA